MKILCASVLTVAILASVANAGFIDGSITVELCGPESPHGPPPWAGPPDFVWDKLAEKPGQGLAKLTELFGGPGVLGHVISGRTDSDPVMTVVKTVENDSGFDWTSYEIALPDDGGIKFVGTPTSDKMTLTSQSDYLLVFGEPDAVSVGETVTYTFDVLIPSTGPFSFTLTQEPVPEPATLGLLALGGLALIRRKR